MSFFIFPFRPPLRVLFLVSLVLVLHTSPCASQDSSEPGVVYHLNGDAIFAGYGTDLEPLDDCDGDGAPEFAVGAAENFESTTGDNEAFVRIHSGRSGAVLHTLHGWRGDLRFGSNITSMGDLSEDGLRELVVVHNDGLSIYDPTDGHEVHRLELQPSSANARVADAGDVDGDGTADLFIGNSIFSSFDIPLEADGRVYAYSPSRREMIWERIGSLNAPFGRVVKAFDDTTGDGVREVLAVTVVRFDFLRLHLLDGSSGETLQQLSDSQSPHFGSRLAVLGDFNNDGIREFAFRTDYVEDLWWQRGRGIVLVHDGRTFEVLRRHEGVDRELPGFGGDLLGDITRDMGDVDSDGVSDYVIATERRAGGILGGIFLLGKLFLYSGKTGRALSTYMASADGPNDPYVSTLSRLGDVDGDGRPEFLIGSAQKNLDELTPGAGYVRVVRYAPELPSFIRGDVNGDRAVDISDVVSLLVFLFEVGPTPACAQAADVDADGSVSLFDASHVVFHIFEDRVGPRDSLSGVFPFWRFSADGTLL